jgi:hypothetical protein
MPNDSWASRVTRKIAKKTPSEAAHAAQSLAEFARRSPASNYSARCPRRRHGAACETRVFVTGMGDPTSG